MGRLGQQPEGAPGKQHLTWLVCVIAGWGISGGAEGREPRLFVVRGLSMCTRLLSLEPRAVFQRFIAFSDSRPLLKYGITPLWRFPGMSRGVAALNWLSWQVRPFATAGGSCPGSPWDKAKAMVQQGWAGLLGGLSLKSSCFLCLPARSRAPHGPWQPRVPVGLSSTGTLCFLRLQFPSDAGEEKPPMSSPCPACPGQHRGLSHHSPRLVSCFLVKATRVVVLVLFRVQTPVQHLLSTATAANLPHSSLSEAEQHMGLG